MAVSVEAAFILLDKASGPLRDIAAQAKLTDKELKKLGGGTGASSSTSGLTQAAIAAEKVKKAMEDADKPIADVKSGMDDLKGSTRSASTELTTHTSVLQKVRGAFSALGNSVKSVIGHFKNFKTEIQSSNSFIGKHQTAISRLTGAFAGLGVAAKNVILPFGMIPSAVMAATSAIGPLVGTVGALVGSLGQAVGGAGFGAVGVGGGLLGSFVVGIGSIAAVAKPAMTQLTNYRTAVTALNTAMAEGNATAIKSAQKNLDALSKSQPQIAAFSKSIDGMEKSWKSATSAGRGAFFSMATSAVNDLRKDMSFLGPEANANTLAMKNAFNKNLGPFLTGSVFKNLTETLSGIFQKNLPGFTHGITNLFTAFDNILKIFTPTLDKVGSGFDRLTGKFAKWTGSVKGDKSIESMTHAFSDWVKFLGAVARLIGVVMGAGAKQGTSMIEGWTKSLNKFTDSLKGTTKLQNFFSQATGQMKNLWPTVKDTAKAVWQVYQALKPLSNVYLKLLDAVAKFVSKVPTPLLTAAVTAVIAGKALGAAVPVFSKVTGKTGGMLGKFFGKNDGSSPTQALWVAVSNLMSGGGTSPFSRSGKAEEEVASDVEHKGVSELESGATSELESGAKKGFLGGLLERSKGGLGKLGGLVGLGGAVAEGGEGTAVASKLGGLTSKLGGLGDAVKDMVKSPSLAGAGATETGLLARLGTSGVRGFGGLTGGAAGMMALPIALKLGDKLGLGKLAETGIGKSVGTALQGAMSGGVLGGVTMGVNALLPKSLRGGKATRGVTSALMGGATGSTLATIAGAGLAHVPGLAGMGLTEAAPGVLGTGGILSAAGGAGLIGGAGLAAGSFLRNKVGGLGGRLGSIGAETAAGAGIGAVLGFGAPGAVVGGAIGGAVGTAQAYNPFSAKGRKNIVNDSKEVWKGIKTGAVDTAKFVAKQAVYYNPFSASGQKHIAQSAVKAWHGIETGAKAAATTVAKTAVKFNPFSESGRKNIVHGADQAWKGVKSGASAAAKFMGGIGKDIAHPFTQAFGWAKNAGKNTFDWMKGAAKNVVGAVGGFFTKTPLGKLMMWPFQQAFNFIKGLPGKIGHIFSSLGGIISHALKGLADTILSPFKSAFSFITGMPGKIGHALGSVGKTVGHAVGSAAKSVGHFIGGLFAQGGTVPRTSTVLVGERGPELVHLPGGSRVIPNHRLPSLVPQYAMATGIAMPLGLGTLPGTATGALAGAASGNTLGNFAKTMTVATAQMNAMNRQSQQINTTLLGMVKVLNQVENEMIDPRTGMVGALNQVEKEFQDFYKSADEYITKTNDKVNWLTDQWQNETFLPSVTNLVKLLTDQFKQLNSNVQDKMNNLDSEVSGAIKLVMLDVSKAFKTLGVTSNVSKAVDAAAGVKSAPKKKGKAQGGRLDGPATGDHIPLVSKGGSLLGIADGGELVVNQHTERSVNTKLAAFGTTLGKEVAGETRPHAQRYARGGRLPGFQTGGVVNQVDAFFSKDGWNKTAIAGILGNAMQESGLNPNTPGGGMWQQISNFGGGTGGSLQAQMSRMLPQIEGIKGRMNAAAGPGVAAQIFEQSFERAGIPAMANRIKYAQQAFAGKLGAAITGGVGGAGVAAPTINAPKIAGSGIYAIGQAGVNAVTAGANSMLQALAGAMGGGAGGAGGPPMTGPAAVQAMIKRANEIAGHRYNYEWGGGHGTINVPTHGVGHGSGPGVGFDCSGSVSAVLNAANLMNTPQVAEFYEGWGDPGPGKSVTIYAKPTHTFMRINGHYFGTSGQNPGGGAGWFTSPEPMPSVRHPHGLATGGRTAQGPMTRKGGDGRSGSGLTAAQFSALSDDEQRRQTNRPSSILPGFWAGGRVPWFASGTDFIAKRPQVIGVGDGGVPERVTVTPTNGGGIGAGGVNITIQNIEVNRKGDVQKIVDQELQMLANSLKARM